MTGAPTGTVTGVPTGTCVPTVTGAAGGAAVARHHLADRRAAMTFNLGGVAA
jgi:hypothetical protein